VKKQTIFQKLGEVPAQFTTQLTAQINDANSHEKNDGNSVAPEAYRRLYIH